MVDRRSLLAGLGAGLTTFGRGLAQSQQQEAQQKQLEEENRRADARLAETQKMNVARLKESDLKIKQLEFENNMKQAAATGQKMANEISAGGYGPAFSSGVLNKYHPGKIAYRFEEGQSSDDEYVFTRGYFERDSDGNPLVDPKTGEKIFEELPGLAKEWKGTPKEWMDNVNKLMDPLNVQAMTAKKGVLDMQLDFYKKEHTWRSENDEEYKKRWMSYLENTPGGKRTAEYEKLRNEQMAMQNKAGVKGAKKEKAPAATYRDSNNNPVELSSQEVETAKANRRALEAKGYDGIRVQEAWRIGNIMDDTNSMKTLDSQLKKVLREEIPESQFLRLHKSMKVPRKFLRDLLDDARENPNEFLSEGDSGPGMQSESSTSGLSGWFSNFFGSMSSENAESGVMF
jgi:hypothetical protein